MRAGRPGAESSCHKFLCHRFQSCAPPTTQLAVSLVRLGFLLQYKPGAEHKATQRFSVILREHAWRFLCARFSGRVPSLRRFMGRDAAGAQQPESTEGIWGGGGISLSVDPGFNRLFAAAVERVREDWPARGVSPSATGVTDPRRGEQGKGPGVTISWSGEQSPPSPTPAEGNLPPSPSPAWPPGQPIVVARASWGSFTPTGRHQCNPWYPRPS